MRCLLGSLKHLAHQCITLIVVTRHDEDGENQDSVGDDLMEVEAEYAMKRQMLKILTRTTQASREKAHNVDVDDKYQNVDVDAGSPI